MHKQIHYYMYFTRTRQAQYTLQCKLRWTCIIYSSIWKIIFARFELLYNERAPILHLCAILAACKRETLTQSAWTARTRVQFRRARANDKRSRETMRYCILNKMHIHAAQTRAFKTWKKIWKCAMGRIYFYNMYAKDMFHAMYCVCVVYQTYYIYIHASQYAFELRFFS